MSRMTGPVPVGEPAPEFVARDQHGAEVRLSERRGRAVLLVFYPYAFSAVCTSELTALRDRPELLGAAEVLAISCDPMFTLRAYADAERLEYPLLTDFWPHGAIASSYGVFDAARGCARRATFALDDAGVIRWSVLNPITEPRDPDEYLRALAESAIR